MIRNSIAFVLVVLLSVSCQEKNKSKKESIEHTKNQKQIIEWFRIAKSLRNKNHFLIKNYADSIQSLTNNETDEFKAIGHIAQGIYYNSINNDSLSFKNYNTSLNLLKTSKTDSLFVSAYSGLGNYYKHTGDYEKSLKNLLTALKIAEKIKDSVMIGGMYANLGQLYLQKDELDQAKHQLLSATQYLKNHRTSPHYLIAIHTMANLQGMSGNINEALKIDEEGLKLCEQIKSDNLKATFLDNKANCFMFSNRLDSARYYFNECLRLDLISKNEKQISDSYANLAQLSIFSNRPSDVISFAEKSISTAEKVNYNPGILKAYKLLIDFYREKSDFKNAYEYTEKYNKVYKNLINERKEIAAAEFKTVYETEKKEKELLISKNKIAEKELQIKKKNTQFQILSLVSLALIVIGYLIYRQQKLKNQQQEQEFQLKSAIKEIETQNQLHEQRLSISRDLHDNIGAQLTFVISSVDNLKYGNQISDNKIVNQLTKISDFTKSTIIELRDTIWAMNKNEFSFDDLRSRIFNFIEKAKSAKEEVLFRFHVDHQLNDKKFTSLVGINVYRTIQEAINNAMKYAEATAITVEVQKINNQIKITIQDDGKGFDLDSADLGNGIQNMKKRIADVGGTFDLQSELGNGTLITIIIT
ncbi:tetratricopeptide repeat-containing sensor histidine kinase [Flavobacterium sp.]|uniref:tetratricopeptide repeat-containing sensor histidine kinase n=1 Tax=Flavobacterium sp. TaxID=239 RepID=UPI002B4ACF94|nr:tetratricopeptide repeat protein [Flavobacterium sp.]HLP65583.1 tetratricopeptide repeat protein [Flavobacterium sp.]